MSKRDIRENFPVMKSPGIFTRKSEKNSEFFFMIRENLDKK